MKLELNDKIAAFANEGKVIAEEIKGILDALNKEVDKNKTEFPVLNI